VRRSKIEKKKRESERQRERREATTIPYTVDKIR